MNVLLGLAVCLSVSPSTHWKQLTCVDVGFDLNFGLGWKGCGLVSVSLLFVIWGGLLFYNFFWLGVGVVFFGILLSFLFYFLFKFFLTF